MKEWLISLVVVLSALVLLAGMVMLWGPPVAFAVCFALFMLLVFVDIVRMFLFR